MVCTDLPATGQNSLTHWKARIWLFGLQKKFQTRPPKPAEVEPSFRKVSLLPAKLRMLFPAHLWVRELWPRIYSLWQALDWGLTVQNSSLHKNGRGLECWKDNDTDMMVGTIIYMWHQKNRTSDLLIHIQVICWYTCCFKVPCGHIKSPPGHLKGLLAISKWHALLVYSGCHHGKM